MIDLILVVLIYAIKITSWIFIIWALLSWIKPDPRNPLVMFLNRFCNPPTNWIRNKFNTVFNGIDLSVIVILLALMFLENFLIRL